MAQAAERMAEADRGCHPGVPRRSMSLAAAHQLKPGVRHKCAPMKWYHIAHIGLTVFLAVIVVIFLVLLATGVIGIRKPTADATTEPKNSTPVVGAKARLIVIRGLRPNWEYEVFEGINIIGRADQQPVEIDLQPQEPEDRRSSLVLSSACGDYLRRWRTGYRGFEHSERHLRGTKHRTSGDEASH